MTEADARLLMVAGNEIVYDGITYKRIRSIELSWDRDLHKMEMCLVLEDMRANSVTRAPHYRCRPVPL